MLAQLLTVLLMSLCVMGGSNYHRYSRTSPLEQYVDEFDPAYDFSLIATYDEVPGFTTYLVNLTSQSWLTPADTDNYLWVHNLLICVPDVILTDTAYLWVSGGSASDPLPASATDFREPTALAICSQLGLITAELQQIPNQPIRFTDDFYAADRVEDSLIAYTWSAFLNDTSIDPTILARFPMTKAAVRAMDAVQEFTRDELNVDIDVDKFIVGGASKRGWVAWTAGAVDERVSAITPVVIPILDMVDTVSALYRDLGEWTYVFGDYLSEGTDALEFLFEREFRELAELVDPISFRRDLEMPKYIIAATGDQFFAPDSANFFFNRLRGESHFYLLANADHSLTLPPGGDAGTRAISAIGAFVGMIAFEQPRPEISWTLKKSKTGTAEITLKTDRCDTPPTEVLAWSADTLSTVRRDFRLTICGDFTNPLCLSQLFAIPWTSEVLTPINNSGTRFKATRTAPAAGGWTGFFIEAKFATPFGDFPTTTFANIVPKNRPFDDCAAPICN